MKKNDIDISIIVPVYNTSKYLDKCLISIKEAIYDNCEVIIVNDGSTDDSEKIIKSFIEKLPDNYKKQFNYYYKKNKGLADTKNFGIEKSKGKYISVVDSDDYISSDFYSIAKKYIDEKYDMIIYDLYVVFENGQYTDYVGRALNDSEKNYKLQLLNGEMQGSSCNKIIKKSLYKYKFPVGRQYEDVAVTPFLIEDAKKIKYLPYAMYYYLQRENSIVNTNTLNSAFYKICENIQKVLNTNAKIEMYEDVIVTFFLKRTISNLELEYKNNKKDFKTNLSNFNKKCNKILNYILKNELVNKSKLELTKNQRYMLKKIYINILNENYSEIKNLFFKKKILNKLRCFKNSFVGMFKTM